MIRHPHRLSGRSSAVCLIAALTIALPISSACCAVAPSSAHPRRFDGFNEHFRLGESSASNTPCAATRKFDDPLTKRGVRIWAVTCGGFSQSLGAILVFPTDGSAEAAWRTALYRRVDCSEVATSDQNVPRPGALRKCKSRSEGVDWVVATNSSRGRPAAAEGVAAFADVLSGGLSFVSGLAPEPAAMAQQTSVSQVTGTHLGALPGEASQSAEALKVEAYQRGQDWRFGEAETVFGDLASRDTGSNASTGQRAEALYNLALNVSNRGRFAEADAFFARADSLASQPGLAAKFEDMALNYKAAHARNQGHYEEAVQLAGKAIALRDSGDRKPVVRDPSGGLEITEAGGRDATSRLTRRQKDQLRNVQAYEIMATSLQSEGKLSDAQKALNSATSILETPLPAGSSGQPNRVLGDATPWLTMVVRADGLRLAGGTGSAAQAATQFRISIDAFRQKYPSSPLPIAGSLLELARFEVALTPTEPAETDRALADYETALALFREQPGSIQDSANMLQGYFDTLLKRIGTSSSSRRHDVERFFVAAQSLLASPSSAEAAQRQAAQDLVRDPKAAALARELEENGRQIDTIRADIDDRQLRGAYGGPDKARLEAELQTLTDEGRRLELRLSQEFPQYASSRPQVIGLDELQTLLGEKEIYIKVFLLADRGYGILVSRTEATPYAIDLSRAQASALVNKLRQPIDRVSEGRSLGNYSVATAHEAFLKIFGPVHESVTGASDIILEPDASLIGLPVSALVVDDASGEVMRVNVQKARKSVSRQLTYVGVAWLGRTVTTSTALSVQAFAGARKAPRSGAGKPFFGFGDPQAPRDPRAFWDVKATGLASLAADDVCGGIRAALSELPPLPQTRDEVQTIAASLGQGAASYALGSSFTDSYVIQQSANGELARYKVLYFATHGFLPQPNGCMQAALLTSLGGSDSDALLDEKKIPKLHLDADMVVLSACDTGHGPNGEAGDALGGLVASFVQAGARNVVVSNWEVEAAASKQLMLEMFSNRGVSQAEALARAERKMMDQPDQYSHPYFWAPFTIVGDGDRAMPAV